MEALNKQLTGDDTEFSEQYFVDCTFTYSGCAGGSANEGYKLTLMRQYMMSAEDWPYTADCMFLKLSGLTLDKRTLSENHKAVDKFLHVRCIGAQKSK